MKLRSILLGIIERSEMSSMKTTGFSFNPTPLDETKGFRESLQKFEEFL
nr:hypothetical protein [Methanothermococcus thermolithotrophicus]